MNRFAKTALSTPTNWTRSLRSRRFAPAAGLTLLGILLLVAGCASQGALPQEEAVEYAVFTLEVPDGARAVTASFTGGVASDTLTNANPVGDDVFVRSAETEQGVSVAAITASPASGAIARVAFGARQTGDSPDVESVTAYDGEGNVLPGASFSKETLDNDPTSEYDFKADAAAYQETAVGSQAVPGVDQLQVEYADRLLGDVDGDNEVSIGDAVAILDLATSAGAPASGADLYAADLDGSSTITVGDAVVALQKAHASSGPADLVALPARLDLAPGQSGLILVSNSGNLDLPTVSMSAPAGVEVTQIDGVGISGQSSAFEVSVGESATGGSIELNGGTAGVRTVSLVVSGTARNSSVIKLENRTGYAGGKLQDGFWNDWLTMSRIDHGLANDPEDPGQNWGDLKFQDTAVLRVINGGSEVLAISNIEISDTSQFELVADETSLTLQPGESHDLQIRFIESSGDKGVRRQTLTLSSNAQNAGPQGETTVELAGVYMLRPESWREVKVTDIARAFGYTMDIVEPLTEFPDSPVEGDEVRSKLWKRADPSKPVYVRQLAAFHGCCEDSDRLAITVNGMRIGTFVHHKHYGQTVLPISWDNSGPAEVIIEGPTENFDIRSAGYSTNTADSENLGVRTWRILDRNGELVPDAYFVAQDYVKNGCTSSDANCDYNDNVYLITNVTPAE